MPVGHPNFIIEKLQAITTTKEWCLKTSPKTLKPQTEWNDVLASLSTPDFSATFGIQQMPGCCAVLILHHIRTNPFTQQNVDQVIRLVEQGAYDAGFGSLMMAQVVGDNRHQIGAEEDEPWSMCLAREWVMLKPFRNAKSGNWVAYVTKDLEQPGQRAGFEFYGEEWE